MIANYNNQKYINECVRSLQNQTYKNIEIIFHDDFSSDNSLNNILNDSKVLENKISIFIFPEDAVEMVRLHRHHHRARADKKVFCLFCVCLSMY